jgi:hypothetical protein
MNNAHPGQVVAWLHSLDAEDAAKVYRAASDGNDADLLAAVQDKLADFMPVDHPDSSDPVVQHALISDLTAQGCDMANSNWSAAILRIGRLIRKLAEAKDEQAEAPKEEPPKEEVPA